MSVHLCSQQHCSQGSTDTGMDKRDAAHPCRGTSPSQKKEGPSDNVTTWMNPAATVLSEISESQKDQYCVIPLMWNSQKRKVGWWVPGAGVWGGGWGGRV